MSDLQRTPERRRSYGTWSVKVPAIPAGVTTSAVHVFQMADGDAWKDEAEFQPPIGPGAAATTDDRSEG